MDDESQIRSVYLGIRKNSYSFFIMLTKVLIVFSFFSICLGENLNREILTGNSLNVINNDTKKFIKPSINLPNSPKQKMNVCCKKGEVWNERECLVHPKISKNNIINLSEQTNNSELSDEFLSINFEIHHHNPCNDIYEIVQPIISIVHEAMVRNNSEFCLANVMDLNGISPGFIVCRWDENWVNVLSKISVTAHLVLLILTIPSLMVTFLIYALLPGLRNNRGYILMCYITCICMTNIVSVINAIGLNFLKKFSVACIICGIVTFYFLVAKFFWLNVMCYDIWLTFKSNLPARSTGRNRKKLLIFLIYAWGCPLILTIICFALEFKDGMPIKLIKYHGPWHFCILGTQNNINIFQVSPTLLIMFCNIFLFLRTTCKIREHKRQIAQLSQEVVFQCDEDRKHWFHLYSKLFILMGIFWPLYVVPWYSIARWMSHLIILFSSSQGIIIFIIFVMNARVKGMLLKEYRRRK